VHAVILAADRGGDELRLCLASIECAEAGAPCLVDKGHLDEYTFITRTIEVFITV